MSSSATEPSAKCLTLHPLDGPFETRRLNFANNYRVTIGRECGEPETVARADNGYFDTKTLSRRHAEIWEDNGKVFIKDTESVNGTFVNGERLSAERIASGPRELKQEDIIVFGHNVFGEDKEDVLHPKVTTRVTLD